MTRTSKADKAEARLKFWRGRIAAQENSGISVERFCEQQGITEQSFYTWRKRLREEQQPPRFALVETAPAGLATAERVLELTLVTGERLRIGGAVDLTFLRRVLEALRA
jgi:transposase-like protein